MWPIVGATLAGFAFRLALARGDLWGDEAASVMLSLRPVTDVLATLASAEPHPPLFPLVLKAWLRVAGTDELVARMPSIAGGTLTVPIAAALGRVVDPRTAVTAAALASVAPFLLWYTTEARMYGLAALGAALASYWLNRVVRADGPSDRTTAAVGYGLSMAAALLTHYFVLYVGLAHALVGAAALRRERRLLGPLALAAAIALLPALAWALFASRIVGSYYGAAPGTVDLIGTAARTWLRLASGWAVEPSTALAIGLAATPVALVGAASLLGYGTRSPSSSGAAATSRGRALGWLVVAWIATPFLVGAAVSLVRPMYQERYLAVVGIAYVVLIATAIARAQSRAVRGSILALALAAAALPIANTAAGRYVRSQYGSHAAEANALARPGEVAILTGPSQAPLYDYYASRGGAGLPVFGLPNGSPAPEPATQRELARIAEAHDGVWLFLYAVPDYDPANVVERWLTENAYRAPPRWTINGRLAHFATERGTRLGPAGPSIALGDRWRIGAALPAGPVAAGALAPVLLDLEPLVAASIVPKLRLRLIDDRGFIWGEADEAVGSGFIAAAELSAGRRRIERRAIAVLAGAPAASLRVEAQLYAEGPPAAEPLGNADLGRIQVAVSDRFWPGQIPSFKPAPVEPSAERDGWTLLGSAGAEQARGGDRAYLTTVWRSLAAGDAEAIHELVGPDGVAVTRRVDALSSVAGGQVRRIQMAPPIGTRWPTGVYQIRVATRRPGAGEPTAWLRLGSLRVLAGPAPTPSTAPAIASSAVFGDAIALRGYSIASSPFGVTLHWESRRIVDRGYSVFVHLVDGAGTIRAQSDGPPGAAAGAAPTDAWSPGDQVDDRRALSAAPGRYRLFVGLYDPASGQRLTLADGGDRLDLGELTVGG